MKFAILQAIREQLLSQEVRNGTCGSREVAVTAPQMTSRDDPCGVRCLELFRKLLEILAVHLLEKVREVT